jgi:hypothetical protein
MKVNLGDKEIEITDKDVEAICNICQQSGMDVSFVDVLTIKILVAATVAHYAASALYPQPLSNISMGAVIRNGHKCEKSPTGLCEYSEDDDKDEFDDTICEEECVHCGEFKERK